MHSNICVTIGPSDTTQPVRSISHEVWVTESSAYSFYVAEGALSSERDPYRGKVGHIYLRSGHGRHFNRVAQRTYREPKGVNTLISPNSFRLYDPCRSRVLIGQIRYPVLKIASTWVGHLRPCYTAPPYRTRSMDTVNADR